MNKEAEEKLRRALREHMAAELENDEVVRAKKILIRRYFSAPTPVFFRPVVLASLFSCIFVCFLFFQVVIVKSVSKSGPEPVAKGDAMEIVREGAISRPPVSGARVDRVSSDVGPTLVFQRVFQGMSLTVVWVLVGGVSQ